MWTGKSRPGGMRGCRFIADFSRHIVTNHLLHFLALDRSDPKKFQILQLIAALLGWDDGGCLQHIASFAFTLLTHAIQNNVNRLAWHDQGPRTCLGSSEYLAYPCALLARRI